MQEEKIKELLSDSIDKLRRTEEIDVKIANEMSNTLNWLTTFATLFFGFMIANKVPDFYLINVLVNIYKFSFIFLVINLITYKFVIMSYESTKKEILAFLDTHYIELKNNLINIKSKLTVEHDFFVNFINSFRDGDFLPPGNNERKESLTKNYSKLKFLGWTVKWFYFSAMILFIINFTIATVFIINK